MPKSYTHCFTSIYEYDALRTQVRCQGFFSKGRFLLGVAAVKAALNKFSAALLDHELKACMNSCMNGNAEEQLGRSGAIDYGEEHFTCFQFDYDWRRDNVENAKLLNEFILEKRA